MKMSMEQLHKDINTMKDDVVLIKNILIEEGELTEETKKGLQEARATPIEEYISQKEMEKEFLE